MNLWAYLDRRGERRIARRKLLLDRGVDARSLIRDAIIGIDPRFIIACAIIGLFAWAYAREMDKDTRNLMVGAMIAAFAGAWGFYLGSSSNAANAGKRSDEAMRLAGDAIDKITKPPGQEEADAILQPGETAKAAGGAGASPARP